LNGDLEGITHNEPLCIGEVYLTDGPGSPADYNSDRRPLQIINRNE
jgi:hypothetical protein